MKTNVSIKFNSIEEYRKIENKLEELGYVNDKYWNKELLNLFEINANMLSYYIWLSDEFKYLITNQNTRHDKTYNSLEEFLKD